MAETTTRTAEGRTDYEAPEWLSLDEDEHVEWMGEPTNVSLVGTAVTGVVLLVVLVGAFLLLALPFQYLGIKNTDYVVTNKALYVKKGVFSTNIESVGLDKIQNTEFSQSFWGKQLGFGGIDISTAGSAGAEISFDNIEDARQVRELITRLSNQFAGSGRSREEAGAGAGEDRMDELIAELRATREAMEAVEAAIREQGVGSDDPTSGETPSGSPEQGSEDR